MNKRYPKYKSSGVEWIGDVPAHWTVKRLKAVTDYTINGVWGDEPTNDGSDLLCVRVADFDMLNLGVSTAKATYRSVKASQAQDRLLQPDDILIEKSGGGENQAVGRAVSFNLDEPAVCSNFVGRMVPNLRVVVSRFLVYVLHNLYHHGFNKRSINQTTGIQNLDLESYLSERVVYPTKKEQQAIAAYLDEKTALIDDTIRKKQQLIELIQEERTALINRAVTRGLDPNVPMKPSGVDWLGEIPAHWKVKKLQFLGTLQNGVSAGAEYFGSGYPFVTYGDVYKHMVLPKSVSGLAHSSAEERERFSVREGDVFFTRTSETAEEIGLTATCMETVENAVFAGFLIRFRPIAEVLYKEFSKYYFRSSLHRWFFVKEMNLVTRASLSQELLKRLPVVLPPIHEQTAIGNYLDELTRKTSLVASKTESEIALLKEYRTALINEVVTGKRCVVPQPEPLAAI